MVKKPPCRICRSRKWRKSAMGFYICEFGHQLEGYQEEEGEYDATMGTTFQRVRKGNKRKRKARQQHYLDGAHGDYLALQAVQLILRKQIYALIHDLGFPPEFEHVAREYWALYISALADYQDKWKAAEASLLASEVQDETDEGHEDRSEEVEGAAALGGSRASTPVKMVHKDSFKDKVIIKESEPDAVDAMEEYENADSKSSSEESDGNTEAEADEDVDEDEDKAESGENEETEQDEEHGRGKAKDTKRPRVTHRRFKFSQRPTSLTMAYTIAICYLSAQHLRLPVVINDFYRWTMHRNIPYYHAIEMIPAEMKLRLGSKQLTILVPKHKNKDVFQTALVEFQRHLRRLFTLETPWPSMPPLIFRFTQDLMLPIEVYTCALGLSRLLFEKFAFFHPEGKRQFYERRPAHLRRDVTLNRPLMGPVYAMSLVILVAKLFYGLDGKKRSASDRLSWLNALPTEQQWLRSLDIYDSVEAQTKIPLWSGEFEELHRVNPDLYSEFVKQAIAPAARPEFGPVLDVFHMTDYAQKVGEYSGGKGESPGIEAFIKRLQSEVLPPEDVQDDQDNDGDAPPPLRPGEGFVHYKADNTNVYLGHFDRLLSYASDMLCMRPEELQKEVSFVEENLVVERRVRLK